MQRIEPRPLHHEVAHQIREMIRKGTLCTGERIVEKRFCDALGISRTPLREALRVLHGEGLVDLLPHRGAFVTQPSIQEVRDLFEVMAVLEGLCARTAAARTTSEDLAKLERLHETLEGCYAARDAERYIHANNALHKLVQQLAENQVLDEVVSGLRQRMLLHRFRQLYQADRFDQSIREHRELLEAFRRRDPAAAQAAMEHHLRRQCEALETLYRTPSDAAPPPPATGDKRRKP